MYSRILATGSYAPEQVRTNADLEKMVDTSDEWITTRSGIKERRIAATDETVATMGANAARKALEMAEIDPQAIDLIVVGTTTNSHSYPSAACQIQGLLGIQDAISFDVMHDLYRLCLCFIRCGSICTHGASEKGTGDWGGFKFSSS